MEGRGGQRSVAAGLGRRLGREGVEDGDAVALGNDVAVREVVEQVRVGLPTVRMQAMVLEHGAGVAVVVVPYAAGAGLARPGVACLLYTSPSPRD